MTEPQQRDYVKQFEAKLISPEEAAAVEARRLQRRLPLPRLRKDLRPHGQGIRGDFTFVDETRGRLMICHHDPANAA